ncbi:Ig-like domain-containing protein, partial [Candidatus Desantisbacteria bacterium]|nr:Ig-like domain-containing protein [Candidatus Desantisbacteria bacterium]
MLTKITRYVMLTTILICLSATAYSSEISKQSAGDAGDKNPDTFKFYGTNVDKQLTRKNGMHITRGDISNIYNSISGDGMRIYDNGIDVCSLEYAKGGIKKKPIGMDLSDTAGWSDITINPGEIGIDPTLGRFKFSTGKAGSVTVVGKYTGTNETYCGVYSNGNYAYLGESSKGMYILDVSNPQAPKKVGMYELGGNIYGLAGDSKYIYLNEYRSDLGATSVRIIDVSNPGTPTTAGNFGVSSRVYDMYSTGNYVFVAHINGLRVVDVSNPKKPSDRGTYEQTTRGTVYGVFVRGDYAYLAHASTGLKILNISDPSNLKEAGQCKLSSYKVGSQPYSVYVSGNYAYISYGAGGLQIIDVSNPSSPVLVGKYDKDINDESFYKTYVSGNYVYVISYKKDPTLFNVYCLRVIDISNPKEPKLIQLYKENIGKPIFDSYDISVSKGLAFVTDASNCLRILDIPMSPELPFGSVTVDCNFVVEPLKVTITSPDGGEVWSGNASNNITWNILDGIPPYKASLYYSTDSGKTFTGTITTDVSTTFFSWTVPGTNTLDMRVKAVVTDANGATANDTSNGDIQVDFIQPVVTETNIPDKAKDISVNSSLIIAFSEPMNQVMTQKAISISPYISNKTFEWSENKKQLTISHNGLSENTTYTCTVSTEARDISLPGNKLKDVYQWSFKTIVPPPGSISVTANIKNASVYLDGSLVGTGSLIINDVGVGSHTLSVQKVNYYPWQGVVLVQSKQTANIYATLTPSIETTLFMDMQGDEGAPLAGIVEIGETFTVSVKVKKVAKLTNMDLFISFDPELLEMLEVKDTAFIPRIALKYSSGNISYGAGVINGSITGNGTIADIVLKAKKKGEAVLSFDVDDDPDRKTNLISGVKKLPFLNDPKAITIAEFGQVDGHVAIDIPRLGTSSVIYVDIPGTRLKTITDATGYFLLKRIPPGKVNIRANGPGLAPDMWRNIEVKGQQTTTVGTITLINGDADGDGRVNAPDFSLLREAYFKTKNDAGWLDTGALRNGYINTDLNGDNKVNTADFVILRDNYFKIVDEASSLRGTSSSSHAPMLLPATIVDEASSLRIPSVLSTTSDNETKSNTPVVRSEDASATIAHLLIELPQDMNKIKVNAEFPVKIKVENVSSLSSMDFSLAFDSGILSVNRTCGDAFLPKITSDIKNSAGFVSHAAGLMTGSANGNGTIATVYFTLRKKQNTKIEFICDAAKNREIVMMSTKREVIPWTSEPTTMLFDGANTIGKTSTVTQGSGVTTTIGTNATATGAKAATVGSMTLIASLKPE